MSFLIFFNSNYSLFSKLFWFEASLSDFLKCLTFWFLGVLGVIFEFLKFSKMLFLIFFNSNYSFFQLFWFEASLSDFLKFLTFWFWGVLSLWNFWKCHSQYFSILTIVSFLNFFDLRPPYMPFWIFWIFGFWVFLGSFWVFEIFENTLQPLSAFWYYFIFCPHTRVTDTHTHSVYKIITCATRGHSSLNGTKTQETML